MKKIINFNSVKHIIASAIMVGALLVAAASSKAGQSTTNVDNFASLGTWWLNGWGGQSANTAFDPAVDHTGDGTGSLHLVDDYSGGDQWVNIGWLDGQMWGGNSYNLTGWTNISFYVKWDAANSTEEISQFNGSPGETPQFWGSTANNDGWFTIGTFTIPDTASNGWVKINVPIDPTVPGVEASYCMGFKKYTGSGQTGVAAFWVDDITLEGDPAAATPPPTVYNLTKPMTGLNMLALSGPYNRESLESVNDQAWIGQSGPVSYSFTITQGVDGSGGAQYQNHIFLVPSPGTESSPDWNEPNVIFVDLESQTSGGVMWIFRYKTNQPSGNGMMYDTNVIPASISNSTPVGKWTLTFNSANSITMTTPSGASTNFTIPADAAALFAGPVNAYFGCQANNTAGIGQGSVLSGIQITGTANPVNSVFTGGTAVNGNDWSTNAVDNGAVFVTPADAAYWLKWSIPDANFSPVSASTLTSGTWTDVGGSKLQVNGQRWNLLLKNQLPSADAGFFKLIKRTYTQLQVLLPGQTNAPGTVLGYVGTPTPISVAGQDLANPAPITVYACDDTWHIVGGVTHTISLTSSDTGAFLPTSISMVNGVATFSGDNGLIFQTTGPQTVTATDGSDNTVPTATSAPVTINP